MDKKRLLGAVGRAAAYLALFLGCQALVSFVLSAALTLLMTLNGALDMEALTQRVYACTPLLTLISGVLTLVILLIVFLARRKRPLAEVGLRRVPPAAALAAVGAAPVLYLAVTLILSLLPAAWLEDYAQASASLEATGVLAFVSVALVSPIVEEIVFRGLILSRLGRAMPAWLALVLSAAVFGLCHGQAVWIAYAFLLGLLFGLMALRSGSILPSLLTHIVFNAIGQLAVVLEERLPDRSGPVLVGLAAAGAALCLIALALRRRGRPEGPPTARE